MNVKEVIFENLRKLGCIVSHNVRTDIVEVRTPLGGVWDFTVPMETKASVQRRQDEWVLPRCDGGQPY